MYSKHESSIIRQAFWTAFGQYISLHNSAEGEKINWINYKTGIKNISFKMYADNKFAEIAIELTHPDTTIQRNYFEQFLQSKKLLRQFLNEDWNWQPSITDEYGKPISKIGKSMPGVNIYNKEHWPDIISFFKPRLIALDEYWSLARYGFENL